MLARRLITAPPDTVRSGGEWLPPERRRAAVMVVGGAVDQEHVTGSDDIDRLMIRLGLAAAVWISIYILRK